MFTSLTKARRPIVVTLAVGALVVASVLPAGAQPASRTGSTTVAAASTAKATPIAVGPDGKIPSATYSAGKYVVVLSKAPIASYTGGTAGIPATKPKTGDKVEVTSASARKYASVLTADQNKIAASVGAQQKQKYTVSLNGFSATLTSAQATKLAHTAGVLAVAKDTLRYADDDKVDYDYLKLAGKNGVWAGLGGTKNAGKGVVIGVIDTGIYPESKSFAGSALKNAPSASDPTLAYRSGSQIVMKKANGQTFTGKCETGEQFTANDCNTKLISARYFGDAFIASAGSNFEDFVSPRDGEGHGTHTASTAGGNPGVQATVDGIDFGKISGVAPAAAIAVYKALWTSKVASQSGGTTSDIVAAIDQAVADGVDVINYSVGGSSESLTVDPIALAFLSAASAGIFVSASAGNSGPGASTLDNSAPWVTTVAASTMKPYEGTVVLGNGKKYAGVSTTVTKTVGPAPFVTATSVKLAAADTVAAGRCTPGTLDPALTAGKIVECDRGVVDRVAKSAEVKRAGGIGMVLVNLTPLDTDADLHTVPTVHLDSDLGLPAKAYAATAGATATLVPGNTTKISTPYPQIAGFSSRGPSVSNNGDILKPDIAAPGVGILASISPQLDGGRTADFLSGTSMAAPHIAGLAALFVQKHPKWSPMEIKSALMTTATDTKNSDGSKNTDPFAQGAGEVNPSAMFNPALVYNAGDQDWLSYIEGLGYDTGTGAPAVAPSDYNQASIASGSLVSTLTVTRTVTAVKTGLYVAKASVPGFKVTVSPSILVFSKVGQTKSFRVTMTRTTAPLGEYSTGFLTWHGAHTTVRSPIALQPVALHSFADSVDINGTGGSVSWQVKSGITGAFPITGYGLTAGHQQASSVTSTTSKQFAVTVPAGTKLARFATRVANDNGAQDIDLVVYYVQNGSAVEVGTSGTSLADETVDLVAPEAGTYIALVNGFQDAAGTTSTPFSFRDYEVGANPNVGSFTVTPAAGSTTAGQTVTVTATASGLDADTSYLGWVQYVDGSGTVVQANPAK
ncbi:PA domain-containing protein [Nakamurella panacisegetis]|uniref:PA domain-containing protein n=1 Tax=Nakamurella panacisegetis TaxID=1090615 RepID=A0A1H0PFU0_9ACTN|nr:S8 family serine peptidase [Nakamurella panacisegetis]SDP03883.1 PA domain-containing protein [Nakamurella panacisegetis]